MLNSENNILSKTRAEEHAADVWGEFYIPPYYNRLSLKTSTKPVYIVGKRGCGKTMLLKYLDFHTAFSVKRNTILDDEVSHIGIYWRVDTQFCNALNRRGLEETEWINIFESYFALVISIEIIRSLKCIAKSRFKPFGAKQLDEMHLPSMPDFDPDYPNTPVALEAYLESKRKRFSTWMSNISLMDKPVLPAGKSFLDSLIEDIRQTEGLEASSFFIYIDEVENLVAYQRKVLNSFLKHSQKPLIINLASKQFSGETETTGTESINASHDFELRNLDSEMSDLERKTFFAEVFLANFDLSKGKYESDLVETLRDATNIDLRATESYRNKIFSEIKEFFPAKAHKELSADALNEPRIVKILSGKIAKALASQKTSLVVDDFLKFSSAPEALIVVPPLLHRRGNNPVRVLEELKKYNDNEDSKFKSGWIDNNLFGCLLELYRPYGGICPIYSGFEAFCTMANNNLRHFLMLCYKSLEVADLLEVSKDSIPVEVQARSTFEAAERLILEITSIGAAGERLRIFVLRLGNIFRTLQSAPTMSESEQNQFTINSGDRSLNEDELKFILEAKKHAVLSEEQETKTKGKIGNDLVDYQLNPIYSAYFQISYRKKRKIELSVEDFSTLSFGNENQYRELLARLSKHQNLPTQQQELW